MKNNPSKKIAVHYKDAKGRERAKNCGNAEGVRACLSWLRRKGFEFIGKKEIIAGFKKSITQRVNR